MNYINEICDGCGRKFTEEDDIVVCPECGTPQHRECWLKENRCVNERLHEDGFEWKAKHTPENEVKGQKVQKRPYPFCGYENPIDAKECENCSQPFSMFGMSVFPKDDLSETEEKSEYAYKPPFEVEYKEQNEQREGYEPFGHHGQEAAGQPFIFNSSTFDPTVLGVETKDLAAYVRTSVPAYYKKFKKFENGKKLSFNFAALIFGPIWFFFRKLNKAGIIFMTLSLCLTLAFYNPLSEAMDKYSETMENLSEITQSGEEISDEMMDEMSQRLHSFIENEGAVMYGYIGATIMLNLAAALAADRLYKKKFLQDMKAVNEEAQQADEKYLLILKKGGVNLFIPLVAYLAMQFLMQFLIKVFFQ